MNPLYRTDYAAAGPDGRNLDAAVVPHVLDEVLVADAGELALGAEGDGDFAVEALALEEFAAHVAAGMAEVERVGPGAVEVDPVGALELRARVFGSGDGHGVGKLKG